MRRLLRCLAPLTALAMLAVALAGCGPQRQSVYPPTLSVQQLEVRPNGLWHLTLRIQNNSYGSMDFKSLDGQLQVAELIPVRLHGAFVRDIPALAGDVVTMDVLPTPDMTKALAEIAAKGSAGSLAYRISGHVSAQPEQEKQPRDFDFSGHDWLSPVPGIPDTFR